MNRATVLVGLCLVCVGCGPRSPREAAAVYEAVLRHEMQGFKNGEPIYVFIDGHDPTPELVGQLRQQWPTVQAGSAAPKGRALRVSFGELKWTGRNTAELQGTFSNGMDGRSSSYRLAWKNGQWEVERAELKAVS